MYSYSCMPRMYLTEIRLQSICQAFLRPVRLVFDWLSDIFGSNNPWFGDEFKLNNPPSEYDAGFRKMFNLEASDGNSSR